MGNLAGKNFYNNSNTYRFKSSINYTFKLCALLRRKAVLTVVTSVNIKILAHKKQKIFYTSLYFFFFNSILIYFILIEKMWEKCEKNVWEKKCEKREKCDVGFGGGKGQEGSNYFTFLISWRNHLILFIIYIY